MLVADEPLHNITTIAWVCRGRLQKEKTSSQEQFSDSSGLAVDLFLSLHWRGSKEVSYNVNYALQNLRPFPSDKQSADTLALSPMHTARPRHLSADDLGRHFSI